MAWLDSSGEQTASAIGSLLTFLALLANLYVNWKREARQRQWQIEDADRLRQEADEREERIKKTVTTSKDEITKAMRTRLVDLGVKFDDLLTREGRRKDD